LGAEPELLLLLELELKVPEEPEELEELEEEPLLLEAEPEEPEEEPP